MLLHSAVKTLYYFAVITNNMTRYENTRLLENNSKTVHMNLASGLKALGRPTALEYCIRGPVAMGQVDDVRVGCPSGSGVSSPEIGVSLSRLSLARRFWNQILT